MPVAVENKQGQLRNSQGEEDPSYDDQMIQSPVPEIEVTDQELNRILEGDEDYKTINDSSNTWIEVSKVILPLSIKEFYDEFLAEGAPFSFKKFCEVQKFTNIEQTKISEEEI